MASDVVKTDGSLDWSGGVNSLKVTTIQSQLNPNGLSRNELAWLNNAETRDGGITPRAGWRFVGNIHDGSALYQGGFMYQPTGANPYLVVSIGGHIYRVMLEGAPVVSDLTAAFLGDVPPFNPATVEQAHFVQAEQFLIIQAGDGTTMPLFWDGTIMRRSKGITNPGVAPGTPGVNEIPPAFSMDYYMGRVWYDQGRRYSAGDIVYGNSGTAFYGRTDAILNVTENPLALNGDGFLIPSQDGNNIRALRHAAAIDAALGQGRLFIFTRKAVYALQVPVTRADWIASGNNNQALQTVVQLVNGATSDRCVVPVNGDLYYQSLEPGIRSLLEAVRFFQQPGNRQISANEQRILQFNDRSLLHVASGILFQDRLWETALPKVTPQGIVHQAIVPLDFIPISSFGAQNPPIWQGMFQGLDMFQLFVGDFGGRERAFAVVRASGTGTTPEGTIQLWEMTAGEQEDFNGTQGNRLVWIVETPAFTWGEEFELKKLVSGELWLDRLHGTVDIKVEYRVDSDACWREWVIFKECSPRNTAEDAFNPISYPLADCLESYRSTLTFPEPKADCATATRRPSNIGYQFQVRLVVRGFCRIRGIYLHALPRMRKLYENMVC